MFRERIERMVGQKVRMRMITDTFVVDMVGTLERCLSAGHAKAFDFQIVDDLGFVADCRFSLDKVSDVREIAGFIEIRDKKRK